jgi:hypothetical protein
VSSAVVDDEDEATTVISCVALPSVTGMPKFGFGGAGGGLGVVFVVEGGAFVVGVGAFVVGDGLALVVVRTDVVLGAGVDFDVVVGGGVLCGAEVLSVVLGGFGVWDVLEVAAAVDRVDECVVGGVVEAPTVVTRARFGLGCDDGGTCDDFVERWVEADAPTGASGGTVTAELESGLEAVDPIVAPPFKGLVAARSSAFGTVLHAAMPINRLSAIAVSFGRTRPTVAGSPGMVANPVRAMGDFSRPDPSPGVADRLAGRCRPRRVRSSDARQSIARSGQSPWGLRSGGRCAIRD